MNQIRLGGNRGLRGGKAYVSEEITEQLLEAAEEAVRNRVQLDVRELAPVKV